MDLIQTYGTSDEEIDEVTPTMTTANVENGNNSHININTTTTTCDSVSTIPTVTTANTTTTTITDTNLNSSRRADNNFKSLIPQIKIDWKTTYLGDKRAIRYANQKVMHNKIIKEFEKLRGWHEYLEIAIDGMSGVGKSSLIASMSRKGIKINELYPWITRGPSYNYSIEKAMAYFTAPFLGKFANVIWDRTCLSNLIFYMVHYLMGVFREVVIRHDTKFIYPLLTEYIHTTGMINVFKYIKICRNMPTIIFVQSDLNMLRQSLSRRNESKDMAVYNETNYHMAQFHVYSYVAKLMDYPLFDLNILHHHGYTIDDIHMLVKHFTDTSSNMVIQHSTDASTTSHIINPANITDEFAKFEEETPATLMYLFSSK